MNFTCLDIDNFFDLVVQDTNNKIKYRLRNTCKPTFEILAQLMNVLPDSDFSLSFFDFFYPKLNDVNAFITVAKHGDELVYTKGSHSASSVWYLTKVERMAAYVLKNWNHQQSPYFLSAYSWHPVNPSKPEQVHCKQISHIIDNIYELNWEYLIEIDGIMYYTDKYIPVSHPSELESIQTFPVILLDQVNIITCR